MNDTLGFMIVNAGKLLIKKINIKLMQYSTELNAEQLAVLYFIFRNNKRKIIQKDIAEYFDKTKSAIITTIDILEEKEYLKRHCVIPDRRENVIKLTKAGNKVVRDVHRIFMEEEDSITKEFNKRDIAICMKIVSKIQEKCKI